MAQAQDDIQRYDILIVGGGPAGLTLALAFARFLSGAHIGLVERRALSVPRDSRASAIAAGVRRIFETLGIWSQMEAAAQPIRAMKITDSGTGDIARPLFLDFEGDVAPGEPFAHMVPNTTMAEVLLEAIEGRIEVIAPAEVAGFVVEGNVARLRLADARLLAAPLIAAADGAQSGLRTMAGISTVGYDYHQAGIVTTIGHELDHEGVAYEHFRPAGPFASLPLPGKRSSLVWTESTTEAARLTTLDPEALTREIEAAMGSTLGAVTIEERVQSFPLRLQIARQFAGERLALIGDAAHVIHPIAGQGLNLGLKDVAALAEAAIEAMRLGMDPGAPDVLDRYQRWRRFDTAQMALVTDGMNRLFSNDIAPVRALRDVGLGLVDRAGPVKNAMIRVAAGVSASGPRLLRGHPI